MRHRRTMKQDDPIEDPAVASYKVKLRRASLPGYGEGSMAGFASLAARTTQISASSGRRLSQVVHEHAICTLSQ